MSRNVENESEILLGNKQLLAVFAVVAILLAVAFTGGYLVGKNNAEKKVAANVADGSTSSANGDAGALTTHTVPPANTPDVPTESKDESQFVAVPLPPPDMSTSAPPLGSPKKKGATKADLPSPPRALEANPVSSAFNPEAGQTFLQVAAVGKDEADAVADVLHKKGFSAHSVPKPGNAKIYRVLIGPLKDAGDLASTRDSLRKTGFREVITQHY